MSVTERTFVPGSTVAFPDEAGATATARRPSVGSPRAVLPTLPPEVAPVPPPAEPPPPAPAPAPPPPAGVAPPGTFWGRGLILACWVARACLPASLAAERTVGLRRANHRMTPARISAIAATAAAGTHLGISASC